ncbi:MAG: 4Fe-4S dicluster domain-containing protein [Coriobacteriales bacterium]|nr:4Fe-4S dicluster domain-containing protein [Coriobacteriales bacterium]
MTQYSIVTDLNKCVGCLACCVSCKQINGVPIGNYWLKILRIGPNPKYDGAQFPDIELYHLAIQCQHCAKPECVAVCPTGASQKMADGTVQIDKEKCIGCQFCVMACPYGVRYLNEQERVVEKCTLCEQKTQQGELPQCVAQCGGKARFFGDLDKGIETFQGPGPDVAADGTRKVTYESQQAFRRTLAESVGVCVDPYTSSEVYKLPDVGNGPSFRYILRGLKWRG